MLREEEIHMIKSGNLLLGFKHLFQDNGEDNDLNKFYLVLAYEKPKKATYFMDGVKGCLGDILGDEKLAA